MKSVIAGATAVAIVLGLSVWMSGILDGADANDSEAPNVVETPSPTVLPPPVHTEPPKPWITDTGVLNSISRDGVPADPNATYPPDADAWSDVICEADAGVYVDASGRVTGIAENGHEVIIEVGEQIATEADFSDLPYMTIAVHRVNGKLELGYRQCWTEDGDLVPTTVPEDRQ